MLISAELKTLFGSWCSMNNLLSEYMQGSLTFRILVGMLAGSLEIQALPLCLGRCG